MPAKGSRRARHGGSMAWWSCAAWGQLDEWWSCICRLTVLHGGSSRWGKGGDLGLGMAGLNDSDHGGMTSCTTRPQGALRLRGVCKVIPMVVNQAGLVTIRHSGGCSTASAAS